MQLTFHGAARTVTGSQHLLEVNGHRLLLECGLFQGRREDAYARNRNFPFDPTKIDAVILSHAHIDHSGNLPHLVKRGFHGPIYTTQATAHLANVMLLDSGHIHESDAEYVNKKRRKRGEAPVEPLYTMAEAADVAQYFQPVAYGQAFEPAPGVRAELVDAGHILGSAAVALDIEEKGLTRRVWFSGDIGRLDLPLLRDPVLPEDAEYLIMECTYGDRNHLDPQTAYEELREVVGRTIGRGGKVIIPSFAVGRTQELVYDLHRMIEKGELPNLPVFVDSPLAVNVTDVFRAHPECFDEETIAFIRNDRHKAALGFDHLTYTRSVEESKALNGRNDPMVIISASGMAETGRILHHLKNNIEDGRNTVLIVSWQAPHTLGRRLADQEKRVRIFGEEYRRRAEVATIEGLSAHAGQDFLIEYVKATRDSLKGVFLVHGEAGPAAALRLGLAGVGIKRVYYPELHERVEMR
ncbi:MAG TPA: MBL fold metallo-hydrolase [Anaerolineales bacterium]